MKLKSIPYQHGTLFVDEQAEIKEGTIIATKNAFHPCVGPEFNIVTPIAQHNLNLEGIPYVELEEDVDTKARHIIEEIGWFWHNTESSARNVARHIAAQPKKYTEGDLKKAFFAGAKCQNSVHAAAEVHSFIQSLQPKIESIEVEMDWSIANYSITQDGWKYISYQKDGKTYLKVKKINYEKL